MKRSHNLLSVHLAFQPHPIAPIFPSQHRGFPHGGHICWPSQRVKAHPHLGRFRAHRLRRILVHHPHTPSHPCCLRLVLLIQPCFQSWSAQMPRPLVQHHIAAGLGPFHRSILAQKKHRILRPRPVSFTHQHRLHKRRHIAGPIEVPARRRQRHGLALHLSIHMHIRQQMQRAWTAIELSPFGNACQSTIAKLNLLLRCCHSQAAQKHKPSRAHMDAVRHRVRIACCRASTALRSHHP